MLIFRRSEVHSVAKPFVRRDLNPELGGEPRHYPALILWAFGPHA